MTFVTTIFLFIDLFSMLAISFDFSMNWPDKRRSSKSYFYNLGLSGTNTINDKVWKMATFGNILNQHNEGNVSTIQKRMEFNLTSRTYIM